MQTVSALYESIIAGGGYWYETQLVIDGVGTYGEDKLFAISTNHEMLQETPQTGKAVAGEITVKMMMPDVDIPVMAKLQPQVRVCNATQQSEWLAQGIYYIDTREVTHNDNGLEVLSIHGYDAMLKAEQMFVSETITGDSTDIDMVDEIASIMGVDVDARTYALMTDGYTIPLPTGYSCREVLGYIASMYVGSFIMSDIGELRLVSLLELPQETNYLADDEYVPITFGQEREEHQLSGQIVSFVGDGSPLVDLSTSFSPVQDLHGYEYPWPPGGGKNLFNYDLATFNTASPYGLHITRNGDLVNVSGTSTNASKTSLQFAVTTTYANGDLSGKGYVCQAMDVTGTHTINSAWGFRTESEKAFAISVANVEPHSDVNVSFKISVAATSQSAWTPYSNLCPISGWTEASVHVSPTEDAEDGTTYTIDLDGTRYGGTLDVVSGVLTVTYKKAKLSQFSFALYSTPSNHIFRAPYANVIPDAKLPASNEYWDALCDAFSYKPYSPISGSDNGKYAIAPAYNNRIVFIDRRFDTVSDFESANANVEIVYPLATPQTYQLTAQQIETLIDTNNVWSDTNGETSLTYSYGGGECRIIV